MDQKKEIFGAWSHIMRGAEERARPPLVLQHHDDHDDGRTAIGNAAINPPDMENILDK